MITDRINYNRLGQAQAFYKGRGYLNVETPWLVTPQAVRATLPLGKTMMETVRGVLLTSGEQGFIQKMNDGEMEPGFYQTTTPCFLDANEHENPYFFGSNETRPYFQQIELLIYRPDDVRVAYERMLNDAMACFFEISDVDTFEARQTDDGFDITFNGTVIGTYGARQMGENMWIYGTGLVEPRFSQAVHLVAQVAEEPQPEPTVTDDSKVIEMRPPGLPDPPRPPNDHPVG